MPDDHPPATLQETIEELTLDIGRILHANTSTLLMVNQSLIAAIETLAPDTDITEPSEAAAEALAPEVGEIAARLAAAIRRLAESADAERRSEALPPEGWTDLDRHAELLEEYEHRILIPEMRFPTLRTTGREVSRILRSIAPGVLSRERLRDALRASESLERQTCLIDLLGTRTSVIQMDASLRALRDFITADLRTGEGSTRLFVDDLVREVIGQLAEFSGASNVDVRWGDRDRDLAVTGEARDISRAIANVLHNAVKYSWHRGIDNAPWVTVNTRTEGNDAVIEIESWGVAITQEEIAEGLVFQLGYRGKWSTDRGRLGTGIGLTDTLRVLRAHGGGLFIDSRPSRHSGLDVDDPEYYRQPFVTRVLLVLPTGHGNA